MEHRMLTLILLMIFAFGTNAQPGYDLARAVVESLVKKDFKVLEPFLLDETTVVKAFPKDFEGVAPEESRKRLDMAYSRVVDTWEMILEKMDDNGIDPKSVVIREVVISPIIPGKDMLGLIAQYEYEGILYEDFKLIVAKVDEEHYLLEMPSSTRTLTLHVSDRSELAEAKLKLSNPIENMPERLEERVNELLSLIQEEDPAMFGKCCVYRGDDETRRWKDRVNTDVEEEMQFAVSWQKKLIKLLIPCMEYTFDTYLSERESEGTWLVQPLKCGDGTVIYFAFLEINGELLLGDIDIEKAGE